MIYSIKNIAPLLTGRADSDHVLAPFTEEELRTMLAVVYTGREHLGFNEINPSKIFQPDDFKNMQRDALIDNLWEKAKSIPTYMDALLKASAASGIELTTLFNKA